VTTSNEQTGLIVRRPQREFSLLPTSLGEAREMAELIANSEFAPKGYAGKPANVLVAVQMGADLGFSPMQSLQNIAVINGRPSVWGDGALALAMPALDRFKEWFEGEEGGPGLTAHCLLKRKGWPDETIRTFSVRDAQAAGLWGKSGPWQTYPKRMLQMRARSWALRDACADLMMGMSVAEEAMDFPDAIPGTVVSVEDANRPADLLESLPDGLREKVEVAFTTLNLSGGQRLAKINQYLGAAETTPEDGAESLLEWCRDELSKRKTGKPRKKAAETNNNVKPAVEPKAEEPPPAVVEAEVVTEAVPATPGADAPVEDAASPLDRFLSSAAPATGEIF
jgi:hypothetical protein